MRFFLSSALCLTLFLTAFQPASAATGPTESAVITGITVDGLERTDRSVIDNLLKDFIGIPAGKVDQKKIEILLRDTGLFDKVEVTLATSPSGEEVIALSLTEKLSFLPIPMFATTGDTLMGGIFVIDANAFGRNDKAAIGILGSAESLMGMVSYARLPTAGRIGFSLFANVNKGETTLKDTDDKKVLSFEAYTVSGRVGLIFAPAPWARITTGLGFGLTEVERGDADSSRALTGEIGASMMTSDWDGWFLSRKQLAGKASRVQAFEGKSYADFSLRGTWEQNIVPRFRLFSTLGGYVALEAPTTSTDNAPAVGIFILPAEFHSPEMAGAALGLEAGLFKTSFGVISARTLYQAIEAKDYDGDLIFHHGPVIGTRVYLSKIAFPAMDIYAAYDAVAGIWQMSFAMGMTM